MKMTKKVISVLLSLMLVLGAVAVGGMSASADDVIISVSDGFNWNGTQLRYEISNYAGLKKFARIVNGTNNPDGLLNLQEACQTACAILMNDIDASASESANDWTPISSTGLGYTGTFDGDGHKITGLTYNYASDDIVGLFGYVGEGGKVQNVGLEGGSIRGDWYTGGVAARNEGTIENCYNTGAVSGYYAVGGVVGENLGGTVTDCFNTGDVSGNDSVGGVVGFNYTNSKVSNCYNTGNISGNDSVGGVVGGNLGGTVKYCYYDKSVCGEIGAVDGADDYTNNVTGLTTDLMTGESAADNMKGLFNDDGSSDDWCITTSYPKLFIKVGNYAELKAFASRVNNGDTGLCAKLMNDIDASASASDPGLPGYDPSNAWTPIGNDYDHRYTGTFDGLGHKITGLTFNNPQQYYAGLFGVVGEGGKVQYVGLEDGSITGEYRVGGVIGYNFGTVTNCCYTGDVSGNKYVGGVVGDNEKGTVTSCYNTGDVSGNAFVGGVVGFNYTNSKVSNCYNTGNVSGNDSVGGVVGHNYSSTISNCYNTGSVTVTAADAFVGGVAGHNYSGTISNCCYDKSVCGEIGAVYGADDYTNNVTGLTTAEMTGIDALSDSNMKFVFESGETNPWLTKADGAEDGGEYYWFYPHLKGFNFNNDLAQMTADEIEAADWPAKAEVSVTLSEYSYEYDGAPKKPYVTSVKIGGKTLEPDTDYTVSYYKSGTPAESPVNAGNYKAVVTFTDTGYAKGHAPIEKEFKITPKAVTVTAASEEFTYDGTAHSNDGYEVRGLVGSDAITAVVTGSITYPSESPVTNKIESYKFTRGNAENYTVTTADGELTMSSASKEITITAASNAWTYDGQSHSDNTVKVTSGELLTGDTLVATAIGSVTNVSDTVTGNNPVAPGYKIMHGDVDVTANYTITAVNGTLTIKPAKVTVTITGKHNSAPYDGEEHTVSGYNVEISNPLYSISDFKYNGVASATEADAGRVEMGLSDSLFENNNQNFDVTFNVTDGYQEIVPISVDVTVKGNSATADYDGNEKRVTGYTAKASNSLYDVENDIEFSGTAEAKRTEPGNESIGLDASQFSNKNANFNATFTVEEDGKLTVNPVIKFVNEDGTELQSGAVAYGETPEYTGETPVKTANDGYAYEFAAWTPEITGATDNATYTATYTKTAIEYTATFVDEKGETVAEVPYTVESGSIEAPAVPGKDGYNGEWEDYELTPGGITVKPVYTPADICPLDNEYHGTSFWGRLVKFFHTVIWKAFNLVGINIYLKIW